MSVKLKFLLVRPRPSNPDPAFARCSILSFTKGEASSKVYEILGDRLESMMISDNLHVLKARTGDSFMESVASYGIMKPMIIEGIDEQGNSRSLTQSEIDALTDFYAKV